MLVVYVLSFVRERELYFVYITIMVDNMCIRRMYVLPSKLLASYDILYVTSRA